MRRIPDKDQKSKRGEFMAEVGDAMKFFANFCKNKRVLKYDASTKTMKKHVVNLFDSSASVNKLADDAESDFVDALPAIRALKEDVIDALETLASPIAQL